MCGIAGIHRLSDTPITKLDKLAGALLEEIMPRGRDATGFAAITDDGVLAHQRAACMATTFNSHRRVIPAASRTVILHTRFATQGLAAFPENNHPVRSGPIFVVHNGHIWNDRSILWAAPYKRNGQVDSEAIPVLLRQHGWLEAIPKLEELDGDAAFAAINRDKPGEALIVRANGSPLHVMRTRRALVWASTAEAIRNAWRKTYGKGAFLPPIRYTSEGTAIIARMGEVEEVRFETGWAYRGGNWKGDGDGSKPVTPTTASTASSDMAKTATQVAAERWARREGMTGGLIYTGLVRDDEEVEDDTLARTYATFEDDDMEPGLDAVRCDDCCDWFDVADVSMVTMPLAGGITNMLCAECKEWAEKAGICH